MDDNYPPPRARRGRIPQAVTVMVGLAVLAVALIGLGVQAVRGNRTVGVQRQAITIHNATVDNAFYRCIDVQARSLVSPSQPVVITGNLGDVVTLIKGVGSWVTIANPFSSASARLSLRDNVAGRHACLGSVVIATYPHHGHRPVVRVGSGASVAGHGPPPAPPL